MLFGDTNPSGKLPYTFGKKLADWRVHRLGAEAYPGIVLKKDGVSETKQPDLTRKQGGPAGATVYYKEGVALGYRGFELDGIKPLFAFGHGLSYTTFHYTGAALTGTKEAPEVPLTLTNSGKHEGAEVVQLYAVPPKAASSLPETERPVRGLLAFAKVKLAPGESSRVTLPFRVADLANWDEKSAAWKTYPGEWTLEVASASDAVRGTVAFTPQAR